MRKQQGRIKKKQIQAKHKVFYRKCSSRCFCSIGLSIWEGLNDNGDKNKNSEILNTVSEDLAQQLTE
jgi:hypothetical protein